MREERDCFMIAAGDLAYELESVGISGDTDREDRVVTLNTPYLSIFCC